MGVLVFVVISVNLALFLGLVSWAVRHWRRETSERVKVLLSAIAAVSGAFVLGAITRLVGVGVRLGWFHGRVGEFIVSEWHLFQSLAATALGVLGVLFISRHSTSFRSADRIASQVSGKLLDGRSLEEIGLTKREVEVVRAIGEGHVSDAAIGEVLFISPATAGTHVKNVLKKTGLRSRRELALLVESSNL